LTGDTGAKGITGNKGPVGDKGTGGNTGRQLYEVVTCIKMSSFSSPVIEMGFFYSLNLF
jgi:hypothetical protein